MFKYITTFYFFLFAFSTYAQSNCGVERKYNPSFHKRFHGLDRASVPENTPEFITKKVEKKLLEGQKQRKELFKDINGSIKMELQFRIHASKEGNTSKIDNKDLNIALKNLNEVFAPIKVQFSMAPALIIENSSSKLNIDKLENATMDDVLAIDVFDDILSDKNHIDGYASLPTDKQDYIFIVANDFKASSNNQVLIHEMGHYFGLLHTFGSVNSKPFPNGDCKRTGDYICDTPPDINLLKETEVDTTITQFKIEAQIKNKGFYVDRYGNRFTELPFDNFMSYYDVRSKFTSGQYSMMKSVIQNRREYLIKNKTTNDNIFVRDESARFSSLALKSIRKKDKGVIFLVINDSIQWCNLLLNDIRENKKLAELFSQYTTCLYDVKSFNAEEVRDRMPGGIGQDGLSNRLQDSLIIAFDPQLVTYPQILIFKVSGDSNGQITTNTILNKIILGYHKPNELCKILEELAH
ncbi:M43 family zinc metalloprotease [Bernardetia sp. OM2101]|uniref:M43 family zinc metalloprotease n=1 Tax=Bernardetia sp. OM2101 TaxID=3344876 RepID=UPI0035CF7705